MIPQLFILLFGVPAIWLVGCCNPSVKRWGYVCGMCGQPFWLWTSLQHEQYAIAGMSLLYAAAWTRGLVNHWNIKKAVT